MAHAGHRPPRGALRELRRLSPGRRARRGRQPDSVPFVEGTPLPSTRTTSPIDDAASADELFSVLMGEDVESRRSFITRNARDVRFLDV